MFSGENAILPMYFQLFNSTNGYKVVFRHFRSQLYNRNMSHQ